MSNEFKPGLYEDLITEGLRVELEKIAPNLVVNEASIDVADLPSRLTRHISRILLRSLESFSDDDVKNLGPNLANEVIKKAVFQEIKSFWEIDPDEVFKNIAKSIIDYNFDWIKLNAYIGHEGCNRLIDMFDRTGAFSVEEINQ